MIFEQQTKEKGIEVRFENGDLWLTQKAMGQLYDCSTDNIGLHLKNIYKDLELDSNSTAEDFSVVQSEGNREVRKFIDLMNLFYKGRIFYIDMIEYNKYREVCMEKLKIDNIKQMVKDEKIRWTNHVIARLFQRNISQEDIKNALLNGEIIEEYENDYPYPSCLIFGINLKNEILHIVCGLNEIELWVITAYYPDNINWEKDFKTRKEIK